MDRFSAANIQSWNRLSADLDELQSQLYFGIEPQRQRHRQELIEALQSVSCRKIEIAGWTRLVSFRFSQQPLSAAGSLTEYGGRFNIGRDVDQAIQKPWPALYIAEDYETAYREKFQLPKSDRVDGLTPEELALSPVQSFAAIQVNGHLENVFDLEQKGMLDPLCRVLRTMKLTSEALRLGKRLGVEKSLYMINTPSRFHKDVLEANWRSMPVQFGMPSPSQIFAAMVLDAGYEAIRYPSTKGGGACLAIFPHKIVSDQSYIQLDASAVHAGMTCARLDLSTADQLCGWELLPSSRRP